MILYERLGGQGRASVAGDGEKRYEPEHLPVHGGAPQASTRTQSDPPRGALYRNGPAASMHALSCVRPRLSAQPGLRIRPAYRVLA